MLRIPHCLDNRLTDGGEVGSLTRRPCSIPHELFFLFCTHLCYRLSKPRGLVRLEGLGTLKKFSDLIGSRIRYLPACRIVPQPTTLPRPLASIYIEHISQSVVRGICVACKRFVGGPQRFHSMYFLESELRTYLWFQSLISLLSYSFTNIFDIPKFPMPNTESSRIYRFVRTSQETRYVSATSPAG
jgi:hypothetical protein